MREYLISEIAEICSGTLVGNDTGVNSVVTDSRHSFGVDEKPVFVALSGKNHDGHNYIAEMYARGVRGFIVEKDIDSEAFPAAAFVVVNSSLRALQDIAADYRKSFKGKMIAITGSSGKTTVKEWLAHMIPDTVNLFRSPRSYNSQLGVPLSILMMRNDEDLAIIEAGISRPGEMQALERIVKPDIGIFTNIGTEHSCNFFSTAEQIAEKARLFASCHTIFYSGKYREIGDALRRLYPAAEIIGCPSYESFDSLFDDAGAVENASIVANVAAVLSGDFAAAADKWIDRDALKQTKPDSMRVDIREGIYGSIVLSDSNNTDVNSVAISLDYLRALSGNRKKIFILTDILFSPLQDSDTYSMAANMVRGAHIDRIIGVGERIYMNRHLFDGIEGQFYTTVDDMLKNLRRAELPDAAILVKGNQSSGFRRILHALQRRSHTTVLEVNLDALIHNLNVYRSKLKPATKIMAMVKASGYGNGNYELANLLQSQGVDYLAVAFADEGVRLREEGITVPTVVLNADADSFDLMTANRLEPEIYSLGSLKMFVKAVKSASESAYPIHIKLDTGMHRLGFSEAQIGELLGLLEKEKETVVVRSIFSHLASADCPGDDDFTLKQITSFEEISGIIMRALPYRPLRHLLNSAGIERFPQAQYDMCRLGIGLYGCSTANTETELRSVSKLATRIVQVSDIPAGDSVGYGRAEILKRDTRLATIPIGYADGLDRRLGNGAWSVVAAGKTAPIVGRVCMDSCMIDVTGIDINEGDEVVIFGGIEGHTVNDMARVLDTIPYEIMTSINDRVKRIFIRE